MVGSREAKLIFGTNFEEVVQSWSLRSVHVRKGGRELSKPSSCHSRNEIVRRVKMGGCTVHGDSLVGFRSPAEVPWFLEGTENTQRAGTLSTRSRNSIMGAN